MSMKTLLLFLALSISSAKLFGSELVIGPVTLISPELAQSLKNAYVSIKDEKIIRVSSTKPKIGQGVKFVEAKDRYLIPGLMDSHVHLSQMPGIPRNYQQSGKHIKLREHFLKQQPLSYLYFGVTQLLDPTQSQHGVKAFNQTAIKPDLFNCGAVPLLGGYPSVFGGTERALKNYEFLLIDPQQAPELPGNVDVKQFTPEVQIRRIKEQGASCVKLFLEDGFGIASHWPLLTKNWLDRIVEQARKHNLKVLAHANAIDMQQIALDAGVDVLTHGMWHWNQYNQSGPIPEVVQKSLDRIADAGVVYQPTFNVMDGLYEIMQNTHLPESRYKHVVHPAVLEWYNTQEAKWFRNQLIEDYQGLSVDEIQQSQRLTISRGERSFSYLVEQKHPMVLASDTPSSPVYTAQPGLSTYKELQHMFKAGLPLKQVLAAATINNAKAFGIDHLYGTVEPGKVANLLLLKHNPLESIKAYDSIETLVLRGKLLDRDVLSASQN